LVSGVLVRRYYFRDCLQLGGNKFSPSVAAVVGNRGIFFSRRVACGPQFFPCAEAIVKYLGINSLLYAAVFYILKQATQKRGN
jgi:hypothetical protein